MINYLSILGIVLTCLLSIVFPIGFIIHMKKRYNASLLYFIMGVIVFSVFQLLLRIPMIQFLSVQTWFVVNISSNTYIYVAFLAITAGLFEEVGRYIAFRYFLMDGRHWENGVAFGIGHGGIEAVSIVGINYILFFLLSLNINYGWFQGIIAYLPQIDVAKSILTSTSSEMFFLAGVERFFVIFIHIAFSLLVLDSVRKNKIGALFLAIFLHALLDFASVLLSGNILIVEGIIALIGIISIYYIRRKKRFWKFMI